MKRPKFKAGRKPKLKRNLEIVKVIYEDRMTRATNSRLTQILNENWDKYMEVKNK